jgi:hypothetical protein
MENKKITDFSEPVQDKINQILELVNKMPMDTLDKRFLFAKELIRKHLTTNEEEQFVEDEPNGPELDSAVDNKVN